MSEQLAFEMAEVGLDVPQGYKRTEIGVIPEDWKILEFGNSIRLVVDNRGKTPPLVTKGFPMLEVNAIFKQGRSPNIDKVTKYVSEITYTKWFRDGHPIKGDILIVTVGSAGETSFVDNEGYCIAQNLISLRLKNNFDSCFIFYLTTFTPFKKQVEAVLMGAVQPSLKVPHLKKFRLATPACIKEQTAIATALSDVDALINELEQLIAKKQAIKTAAMQQLLTGRTRLPQFALRDDGAPKGYKASELGEIPEDWEVEALGSLVAALDSGVSVNSLDKTNAFSHGKHILKTSCVDGGYFDESEVKSILPNDLNRAKCPVKKGTIIVSRMNTPALVGELGYVPENHPSTFLPDRLWQMSLKNEGMINSRWLAYLLSFPSISKKIKESATGTSGSMKNISKDSLLSLAIPILELKEQTAIASIPSDMDSDISSLQQRLSKTRQIKQGMMQELLTGKTRLKT